MIKRMQAVEVLDVSRDNRAEIGAQVVQDKVSFRERVSRTLFKRTLPVTKPVESRRPIFCFENGKKVKIIYQNATDVVLANTVKPPETENIACPAITKTENDMKSGLKIGRGIPKTILSGSRKRG